MWNVYIRSGSGVAIRSTFDRLKTSLAANETTVYAGRVEYIDYSKESLPGRNLYSPVIHKRKSFEHEAELRAVVAEWVKNEDGSYFDFEASAWDVGVEVEVDLGILVERIHVSPTAPEWFAGLVAAVTARYGFTWGVTQSLLLEDPLF